MNNNDFYEYNDNRSIHQPSLFDLLDDIELSAELLDEPEDTEIYEPDFEELEIEEAVLFLM